VHFRTTILFLCFLALVGLGRGASVPESKPKATSNNYPVITGDEAEFNGELATDTVTGHAQWK